MEHGHSNHLQNSNVKFFFGSSSIASPLCWSWSSTRWMKSGWTLNINFSDVGSCRSSATSDLPFAAVFSQKSPRKRWTLLFLGCKRQPLPKQSTTTMIRHVLELLDLTGLRSNIRKINSKAKPGMQHQSLSEKLLVSVFLYFSDEKTCGKNIGLSTGLQVLSNLNWLPVSEWRLHEIGTLTS